MRKLVLALSLLAAPMATLPAFAQGEVGGVKKAPDPTMTTPEDKAAGKASRKAEGRAAAKEAPPGLVGDVPAPPPPSTMSKSEKSEARAARKAEAAAANKGPSKTGEVGPTK